MSEFEGYTSILNNPYSNNNVNRFFNCDRYMLLKIKVISDSDQLKDLYLNSAIHHNEKVSKEYFFDAGFDLFSPTGLNCFCGKTNKINFGIQCAAKMVCESGKTYPTGFYIYPRSSTGSKTPLRLANSVGIIDSGYRGNLIGMFDCVYGGSQMEDGSKDCDGDYLVRNFDKLVQICAPGLVPIYVEVVEDLGVETDRGAGGFGSTGR